MIIKSISLKNFQCYFGEHDRNTFEFSEGLNLVIGDNAAGKSKIFDAFYWVINDQIFDTKIQNFLSTRQVKESLISDKAKADCSVGSKVSAEVVLTAKTSKDDDYRFTRILQARKAGAETWECDGRSKLIVDRLEVTQWRPQPQEKHKKILDVLIPAHLREYMWFQGEAISTLMDFADSSALARVVNLLSQISIYDDLTEIVDNGYNSANSKYRREEGKKVRNQNTFNVLDTDRQRKEDLIEVKKREIQENQHQLEKARRNIEKLVINIEDANRRVQLDQEREDLLTANRNLGRSLKDKYNKLHKNMFLDSWVLKNSNVRFKKYERKYKTYFESHNAAAIDFSRPIVQLPINIPQPIHVNRMLEEQKCFVCDRDAKKGSTEYEFIRNLLDREKTEDKKEVFKNDCSDFFSELYNNGLSFKQLIAGIDDRVTAKFDEITMLQAEIDENKNSINNIDQQFVGLVEEIHAENIVSSYRTHERNRERYQDLVKNDEDIVKRNEDDLVKIRTKIKKLVVGDIDKVTRNTLSVFSELKNIAEATRHDVFQSLIDELENHANALFESMSKHNEAVTGTIRLRQLSDGNYIAENVGLDGHPISNPNASNIALVNLSLIMAILISRGRWSENYSLIADNPTSSMASRYTYGVYKTLGASFTQSIVFTYDFLKEGDREPLADFKLGSVHTIHAHFQGGDRKDQSDLETIVNRVQ